MLNHRELWNMRVLSDRGILQLQGRSLGGRCREYGHVHVDYIHQVSCWTVRGGTRREMLSWKRDCRTFVSRFETIPSVALYVYDEMT